MGAFYQKSSHLAHDHFKELFTEKPSDFVQLKSQTHHTHTQEPEWCFGNFNPQTKDLYDQTVENWSNAYLDVAEKVAFNLKHPEKSANTAKLVETAESVDTASQLPVQQDFSSA